MLACAHQTPDLQAGNSVYFLCCVCAHSAVSDSLDPMDYSPPGSCVHWIFQARILEWVAISYSRGSSRPRDQTCVCWVSIGRQVLYRCATLETCLPFRWLLFNLSCALLSSWLIGTNYWFKTVMATCLLLINTVWVFSMLGKIMWPSSPNPKKQSLNWTWVLQQLLFSTY